MKVKVKVDQTNDRGQDGLSKEQCEENFYVVRTNSNEQCKNVMVCKELARISIRTFRKLSDIPCKQEISQVLWGRV